MGRFTRPLVIALIVSAHGCSAYAPVQLLDPGTAQQQQARAVKFDPYPEQELGPAVVGGRPRDYQNPPPETVRAQGPSRWFYPVRPR